jgi:hypothetical protein
MTQFSEETRYVIRRADGSERPAHVLLVTYLFPPCDLMAVRRPAAFRDAFDALGVRTTVLTSAISGTSLDDHARRVVRSPDLRTRFATQFQALAGFKEAPVTARTRPRWWTRLIVPDVTALSWGWAASINLARVIRADRPDAVFTTSPPESAHLLGLAAHSAGIPWIADFRDGWMFEAPSSRPYARAVDRALERLVVRRADLATAINEPITDDLRRRYGIPAVHLTNGFDPRLLAHTTDERKTLDPARFSLVYTGTLAIDVGEALHDRGASGTVFLAALRRLLAERPQLRRELELVFAGNFSEAERQLLVPGEFGDVVRVLGRLPHERALGLQHSADGLLLVVGTRDATTGKMFEYLAAEKPIFAIARRNSAAAHLLGQAGPHMTVPPDDEDAILRGLRQFADRWMTRANVYSSNPDFDLGRYSFPHIAGQLLDLFVSIGAFEYMEEPRRATT